MKYQWIYDFLSQKPAITKDFKEVAMEPFYEWRKNVCSNLQGR